MHIYIYVTRCKHICMILYDVVCIHHQIILVHIIYSKTSILYILWVKRYDQEKSGWSAHSPGTVGASLVYRQLKAARARAVHGPLGPTDLTAVQVMRTIVRLLSGFWHVTSCNMVEHRNILLLPNFRVETRWNYEIISAWKQLQCPRNNPNSSIDLGSYHSHPITNWTKSQQWSHWFLLWTHWSQRVAAGFALLPWDSVGCNVIVFVHIHGGIHLNIAVPLRTALLLKGTPVESMVWGGLMIFFAFFCLVKMGTFPEQSCFCQNLAMTSHWKTISTHPVSGRRAKRVSVWFFSTKSGQSCNSFPNARPGTKWSDHQMWDKMI